MSDWTREQRARAAADLCERAALAFRSGDDYLEGPRLAASLVAGECSDEATYRFGLAAYGAAPADIDAAVAAILAGGHPADSLAGRVEAMKQRVENEVLRAMNEGERREFVGYVKALAEVLALLGVPQ